MIIAECQPMSTPVMHYRKNIENPTMPSVNVVNPTITTSVMHYTENITGPIGQNNINLGVIINEVVTKFLSCFIFHTH